MLMIIRRNLSALMMALIIYRLMGTH